MPATESRHIDVLPLMSLAILDFFMFDAFTKRSLMQTLEPWVSLSYHQAGLVGLPELPPGYFVFDFLVVLVKDLVVAASCKLSKRILGF